MSRTLEARQLTKHFAGTREHFWSKSARIHAVDDVSFTLRPGRITALVGESGSGKSTVAQLLARLYDPTAGRIVFDGQDATGHASRAELLRYRSRVQMIFQDPFGSLNPVKTVEHHLRRPLLIHGLARREHVRAHIHELLATVGLVPPDEFAAKYPHQLSGGQRQRVAIARALAVEPSVLLADEPISMLDVSIRIGILNLMLKLKQELGIAFLYVTHDIASARYVADEVLVMYAGQIVEQGPTESVLQEPLHPYTRLLLSAVPEPGAVAKRIEPRPPRSDVDLLAGCRFVDRCPLAIDVCTHVPPKLVAARLHHSARCHVTAPAPDREDDRVEHLHELRS